MLQTIMSGYKRYYKGLVIGMFFGKTSCVNVMTDVITF